MILMVSLLIFKIVIHHCFNYSSCYRKFRIRFTATYQNKQNTITFFPVKTPMSNCKNPISKWTEE